MIYLQDLHLAFGGRKLFDGLTWAVKPRDRVGLIGPNGAGKSTLLRAIAGTQTLDAGEVRREGGATVGYLAQDVQELSLEQSPLDEAVRAFEDVHHFEAEVERLSRAMEAHPDHESDDYFRLVEQMGRAHTELAAREHHLAVPKAEAVLSGLGFSEAEMNRPLHTFSGGWRMRVALARILLTQPDTLLLDEPTNHLDIESIDWLEGYLKGYPGAVVLVSHDRYFLDRMVTSIAELQNGRVEAYAGNYAYYLEERAERRALWAARYENQQREIAEMERFVERFRYKATKAKQAQSRLKTLEKMDRIPPPPSEEATVRFRFPEPSRPGRTVVAVTTFSKAYPAPGGGSTAVFRDAGPLRIERGAKIALVGKNGAGKSTLARILLGEETFKGTREEGLRVQMAHFAQHQAEEIPSDLTVLEALRERARGQSETELRSLLGAFLFSGEDAFKSVSVLSGGERSRLALARTLLSPANVLVLDEPTNHLDIASKEVLAEALRQYAGSFVIVSHDRFFLDAVVNEVWYVEGGGVKRYPGTYTEAQWRREHGTASRVGSEAQAAAAGAASGTAPKPAAKAPGKRSKEDKRRAAEMRQRVSKALKGQGELKASDFEGDELAYAVSALENEIGKRETKKEALEAQMADPALYDNPDAFQKALKDHAAAEQALADLYRQWEALAGALAEG